MYRLFQHEMWNIGIAYQPISTFLAVGAMPRIRWLSSAGKDRVLADPFAIVRNQSLYILFEDFSYRTSKGRIAFIELKNGRQSTPKVAIEESFHMSYPCLFEYQGDVYCVPETHQLREIILYKAMDFPSRWRRTATLVSRFAGLDSTIFEHDGRWWLASAELGVDRLYRLYLWHAKKPIGPWIAHAANPVKADSFSSRPAGTPFLHEGCLYRPAQDCSRTYGGRIIINRVVKLTPTVFEEKTAAIVEPSSNGPYPDGLHTISAVGNLTVVDGKRHIFEKYGFRNASVELVSSKLRAKPWKSGHETRRS